MLAVLLKTLPFFALTGLGYRAGRMRFFMPEATACLTSFVFYFALSAMLMRFAANLLLPAVFGWNFVFACLCGCLVVCGIAKTLRSCAECRPERRRSRRNAQSSATPDFRLFRLRRC